MAKRFPTDYLGQSPSLVAGDAGAGDYLLLAEAQGTSPETYAIKVVDAANVSGSSTTADKVDKTADFTLALTDAGKIIYVSIVSSPLADITCTVPTNASVAFPTGTLINIILESNGGASPANKLTITGDTGVTVNGTSGGSVNVEGNYSAVALHKMDTNEWSVVGTIS